jgi:RNA-directed DNA polymerase
MNNRKLTVETFLSIISNNANDRNELLKKPIPSYNKEDITESKIGTKTIFQLKPAKSQYQEKLNKQFFTNIELNISAVAYVKKKSYLDMFEPHRNNYNFIRIDIKSFFHSINRDLLKESLSGYVSDEIFYEKNKEKQSLLDALINILSLNLGHDFKDQDLIDKDILPIGFKSSPVISNIVFRKFDYLIQVICSKNNIVYTRYADDMLFSSPFKNKFVHSERFMKEISYILSLGGFKINTDKTIKEKCMISLNGYVIENKNKVNGDGEIRLSNNKTKIISKLLNKLDNGIEHKDIMKKLFGLREKDIKVSFKKGKIKFISQYYKSQIINVSSGYRAYLISIIKFNSKYNCVEQKKIDKYQKMIDGLQKHLLLLM